jgi:prenylcysteine oxidase / farnesylcysteine lyase
MAPEGAVSVAGGNWQIFDSMIRHSNATVHLNQSVTSIALDPTNDPIYPHTKYLITTKSTQAESATAETYPIHFDNVVIATPWQFSDITAEDGVIERAIDEIPYTKLHVTLLTSPFQLSPAFFSLEPGAKPPSTVLTTLGEDEEPRPGAAGVGKSGFYSISTLRVITNPKTMKEEYLYKIFSPEKLTSEFLSSLLGVQVPETFTRSANTESVDSKSMVVDPISWYHPHAFYSYPMEYPRVTFQDPILRSGLYYTSGIESFISTMETSGLMGMNIARLIADDFLSQEHESRAKMAGTQTGDQEDVQNVLGETQDDKTTGPNATAGVVDEL